VGEHGRHWNRGGSMSYKQVHETFWTAPDVKKYTPNQRYLFIYFITSPHAHYSGLYYLPLVYIQNETGSQKDINQQGSVSLGNKGLCLFWLRQGSHIC
jgi:hypothetical protein